MSTTFKRSESPVSAAFQPPSNPQIKPPDFFFLPWLCQHLPIKLTSLYTTACHLLHPLKSVDLSLFWVSGYQCKEWWSQVGIYDFFLNYTPHFQFHYVIDALWMIFHSSVGMLVCLPIRLSLCHPMDMLACLSVELNNPILYVSIMYN